jgi:hypothetical protein
MLPADAAYENVSMVGLSQMFMNQRELVIDWFEGPQNHEAKGFSHVQWL